MPKYVQTQEGQTPKYGLTPDIQTLTDGHIPMRNKQTLYGHTPNNNLVYFWFYTYFSLIYYPGNELFFTLIMLIIHFDQKCQLGILQCEVGEDVHIFKSELSIPILNYGLGIVPISSEISPTLVRDDSNAIVTIQYVISPKFCCKNGKKTLNCDTSLRFSYDLGNIIPSQGINEIIDLSHFHK